MSTQPKHHLTPEEYLEIERKAEFKSEYFQGEMFAMSGARRAHNLISGNVGASLHQQLRKRPCETYSNDMRVCVKPSRLYTYPDIVIVCGEPKFLDSTFDTLLNPTVIIEILSESTDLYDRGRKFELYRGLETLAEYMMISSLRVSIENYVRQPGGVWTFIEATDIAGSIHLPPVDCHLALADVYERVEFPKE